ncbi:MAG: hypothetical protein ACPGVZ_18140, partial [Myxococcota bacterium]
MIPKVRPLASDAPPSGVVSRRLFGAPDSRGPSASLTSSPAIQRRLVRFEAFAFCFAVLLAGSASANTIFQDRAFADTIVASSLHSPYDVSSSALGRNDWTADMVGVNQWGPDIGVALGYQGFLTVGFTDNAFGSSGNADADVWIFEIGGLPEEMSVEISIDGASWLDVGIADRPSASFDYGVGIDIDPFFTVANGFDTSTRFNFLRVTDTGNNTYNGNKSGADIDAIAAIYPLSENVVVVPEPGSSVLIAFGLAWL